MIELYEFQSRAADQIADRFVAYCAEPLEIGRAGKSRRVPFIQLLSSITASGKTIILADAVSSISKQLPTKPVVLWLSKATVVVEQTYMSLDAGGGLHELIDDFSVHPLADYDPEEVADTDCAFLYFATVGTFNQKDKEQGSRRVYRIAIDDAAQSIWQALQVRADPQGNRRPLLVVYDEAHNLSDQQTVLLLELEPDAILLATATQRVPHRFNEEVIEVLIRFGGKEFSDLVTLVDAKTVADSGLVKTTVELVGRRAPMEDVVEEMLREMAETEADARRHSLPGSPKAVYICRTNVLEGSDERENYKRPFSQRQAPPILIWRHLTEKLGIDPSEIAVYLNLRVDKAYPLPRDFVLFSGGDKDYERFISGGYRHIIFNQSLQEGWDDPLVYFAYIDKSMSSLVQVEQVVGRLLRQPGRHHYPADRLNTAQIHVRVESTGVFDEVVSSVQTKINNEDPSIRLIKSPPGTRTRIEYPPKGTFSVPVASIITYEAEGPINHCIATMTDYRPDDGTNTIGLGWTTRVQKVVGEPGNESFVWEETGNSAFVLARWLFDREVRRVHKGALGLALTSNGDGSPSKFDVRIGLKSNAAVHIASIAEDVAHAFIDNVYLKLRKPNPYTVTAMLQQATGVVPFDNAVHSGYEGLSPEERNFANAIDRTGLTWCRNPPRSGYGIPLVIPGRTEKFFPDFLVWSDGNVFALDTKGPHLHTDAMRKLVQIRPADQLTTRVFVRFITVGLVDESGAKKDPTGFTVWSFKPNGTKAFTHFESVDEALARCLKPDV